MASRISKAVLKIDNTEPQIVKLRQKGDRVGSDSTREIQLAVHTRGLLVSSKLWTDALAICRTADV